MTWSGIETGSAAAGGTEERCTHTYSTSKRKQGGPAARKPRASRGLSRAEEEEDKAVAGGAEEADEEKGAANDEDGAADDNEYDDGDDADEAADGMEAEVKGVGALAATAAAAAAAAAAEAAVWSATPRRAALLSLSGNRRTVRSSQPGTELKMTA